MDENIDLYVSFEKPGWESQRNTGGVWKVRVSELSCVAEGRER